MLEEATDLEALLHGKKTTFTTDAAEIAERPLVTFQPLERLAFTGGETVALEEIAHVKDGISWTRSSKPLLVSESDDGDPSLRPCLEGKDVDAFVIRAPRFFVRYAPERISEAERRRGTSLREKWIFDSPKIVYRQTAPRIIAAVDLDGRCALKSLQCIVLRKHDEKLLAALCTWLNSSECMEQYQARTGETRRVFPQVHVSAVKKLRVPRKLLRI
jgi:hypothetical protein